MAESNKQLPSIKGRWAKLDGDRSSVLSRARECAKLTIPQLLPPQGSNANTTFNTPWQALGARGVNNLSSKLILALFPPNQPFFRLKLDEELVSSLANTPNAGTVVEESLAKMESRILDEMESRAIRMGAFEACKHLIVTGNSLVFVDPEQGTRVYRLDQYCVKRDPMGNVLEIVTKEQISYMALPEDLKAQVELDNDGDEISPDSKPLDLYTRVVRGDGVWDVYQEINEVIIPDSMGVYPIDKSPFIPLRWSALAGEDYGRGLVEEYLGDLKALDILSQSIIEGSEAAARVLVLVSPNGTTRINKVVGAANLDVIEGNADDVSFLTLEKYADFRVAMETAKNLETRLSASFLLNSSVQRQGERVTAEEIRYMAKELEDALGGVYSVLSKEFQLPLIQVIKVQMEKANQLPIIPEGKMKLVVTTGLEALGRSHDLVKLNTFINELNVLGPEQVAPYLIIPDYIARVANATGIDAKGLIRSEEEVQQAQQAQMQSQQQAQLMSDAMKSGAATELVKGVNNASQQGAGAAGYASAPGG